MSSGVPLNRNWSLTLSFFDTGNPSSYHFLKLALSKSALPMFQESPRDFYARSLDMIVFVGNGIVGEPSTLLLYGIQMVSHGFTRMFFDDEEIMITVYAIISWHRKFIHSFVFDGNLSMNLWEMWTLVFG